MIDGWEKYQTLVLDKLSSLEKYNSEIKIELVNVSNKLSSLERDQVENTANVRYHIKRTDASEERIKLVEERLEEEIKELRRSITNMQESMRSEMQEVRGAIQGWKANISLLGWLFSAITIIVGILLRFYNI